MKKLNISIIGVGLMGGSIGLCLRQRKFFKKYNLIGVGRNLKRLEFAKSLGVVDQITTSLCDGTSNSDIIFVCTPIDDIANIVAKILPYLKPGAIVTDIGSVKTSVISDVYKVFEKHFKESKSNIFFVGSHPMAGYHSSGVKNASKDLYIDSNVALVPTKYSTKISLKKISSIWKELGACAFITTAQKHDQAVALTSHLSHVLAYSVFSIFKDLVKVNPCAKKLCGGSFKGLTRVAYSDPKLWTGICLSNHKFLSTFIDELIFKLKNVKNAIQDKNLLYKLLKSGIRK